MKQHLLAYRTHAALNLGAALRLVWLLLGCIWYGLLPPQWTGHKPDDIDSLASGSPWDAFADGLMNR